MNKLSDKEIISALKQQTKSLENQVLNQLYPNNYKMIRKLIKNNSGSEDDAVYIFHDGLIDFMNKCRENDFSLNSAISTYLYSICRNKWLNELRKRKNNKEVELNESLPWKLKARSIQKQLEEDQGKQLLHKILTELKFVSSKCFEIIDSFYFESKRLKEVMVDLDIPSIGATKTQKDRCMKKLKVAIKRDDNYAAYLKEYLKDL